MTILDLLFPFLHQGMGEKISQSNTEPFFFLLCQCLPVGKIKFSTIAKRSRHSDHEAEHRVAFSQGELCLGDSDPSTQGWTLKGWDLGRRGCCLPGLPFWAPNPWLSKSCRALLAQVSITSRNVLELDFMKRTKN